MYVLEQSVREGKSTNKDKDVGYLLKVLLLSLHLVDVLLVVLQEGNTLLRLLKAFLLNDLLGGGFSSFGWGLNGESLLLVSDQLLEEQRVQLLLTHNLN